MEGLELEKLFRKYDADGDQVLTTEELQAFYSDLCERRQDVKLSHPTFEAWQTSYAKNPLTLEDMRGYLEHIKYNLGLNLYCADYCVD